MLYPTPTPNNTARTRPILKLRTASSITRRCPSSTCRRTCIRSFVIMVLPSRCPNTHQPSGQFFGLTLRVEVSQPDISSIIELHIHTPKSRRNTTDGGGFNVLHTVNHV